jgi:hypothetical protein
MSYPPEADMYPEEWTQPKKLNDVEAEDWLEHERRKEWNTSLNR